MKLHEWHQNPKLVKSASDLHTKNDTFIRIGELLVDESPLNNPLSPTGPTADDRSYRLGLIEGYHQCLKNLRSVAVIAVKRAEIPTTYAPPET